MLINIVPNLCVCFIRRSLRNFISFDEGIFKSHHSTFTDFATLFYIFKLDYVSAGFEVYIYIYRN